MNNVANYNLDILSTTPTTNSTGHLRLGSSSTNLFDLQYKVNSTTTGTVYMNINGIQQI